MSVIKPAPIAAKIRGSVPLTELLPRGALQLARASLERNERPGDHPISARAMEFLSHYMLVCKAGWSLVSEPAFESLARQHERLEDEFMSGGPPTSPIYDSYSALHTLAEIPIGIGSETPATVLARLTAGNIEHRNIHLLALQIATSHLDLYRAKHTDASTAQIVHVRPGVELDVHLSGPFLRDDDLFLGRVFRFHTGEYFVVDSPYVLVSPEAAWLDYFDRVTEPERSVPQRPQERGKKAKGKKREQRPSQGGDKEARLVKHLRFGDSPAYWPEFIVNAYAGERNGIVMLAGIPDMPETQPQHEDFDEEQDRTEFEFTPEIEAELLRHLMTRLKNTLDEPIPMFRSKTLREMARDPNSRPDAVSWLRDQERILRDDPQTMNVDLRPLWDELGLDYQGLDTEPAQ